MVLVVCDKNKIWDSLQDPLVFAEPEMGHIFNLDDISDPTQCDYPSSRTGFPLSQRNYLKSVVLEKVFQKQNPTSHLGLVEKEVKGMEPQRTNAEGQIDAAEI